MKYLPFLIFLVVIVGLVLLMSRVRRRAALQSEAQVGRIDVGTEVMTTSGLYGTVVTMNGDRTVQLSIAPGLEVRWELAALRDLTSLPPHVGGAQPADRQGISPYDPPSEAADAGPDGPDDAGPKTL